MKTIEQMQSIKKQFLNEYRDAFRLVGNNIAAGIGKDPDTQQYVIAASLTNNKLKNILPKTYQEVKVEVEVIGEVKPQKI